MPVFSVNATVSVAPSSNTANTLSSNVLVANTAKLIAPANTNRKQLSIFNSNSAITYIGYDNTVSASNYAFSLAQNGYFELPNPTYTGNMYAFCAVANTLSVIEFV